MSESCPGVVLIVDGDSSNVTGLRNELATAGYMVLDAGDAPGAITHLNSHHVDVVITELRLRGGDGLQLIDHIKKACPDTRVMIVTSDGTIESAVEAMKRGSTDFMARPASPSTLVQKIREITSAHRNGKGAPSRSIESPMGQMNAFSTAPTARLDGSGDAASGLTEMIEGLERSLIESALKRAAGNQAKAAQFLRIPRTTLRDKMTKYGMVGEAARRQVMT